MIRVLLVDDHPAILDGLAAYLNAAHGDPPLCVAGAFGTQEAALAALPELSPEVAVLDIKLQGSLAFSFVPAALALKPDLKVVFITGHDDDLFIERALQAGAMAYVLKTEPLAQIAAAIRAASRGERYFSDEIRARFSDIDGGREGELKTRVSLLTRREREVLHYVSQGLSAKEISETLKISIWTVTNHKANIMAKLGIHNQVGLTRFAVSTGLADAT